LAYISVAESILVSSTTFTQSAQKATEFGHYAVQYHSRSPISVPIKSPYMQLPIND